MSSPSAAEIAQTAYSRLVAYIACRLETEAGQMLLAKDSEAGGKLASYFETMRTANLGMVAVAAKLGYMSDEFVRQKFIDKLRAAGVPIEEEEERFVYDCLAIVREALA